MDAKQKKFNDGINYYTKCSIYWVIDFVVVVGLLGRQWQICRHNRWLCYKGN